MQGGLRALRARARRVLRLAAARRVLADRCSAMLRWVVLALTAVTGLHGLAYEVTWQKYLGILLGAHSEATAAVLGLFLGGLSLGYWALGALARALVARGQRAAGRRRCSRCTARSRRRSACGPRCSRGCFRSCAARRSGCRPATARSRSRVDVGARGAADRSARDADGRRRSRSSPRRSRAISPTRRACTRSSTPPTPRARSRARSRPASC